MNRSPNKVRRLRRLAAACVVAMAVAGIARAQGDAPAEPDGFRLEEYRAPVPATLKGARVIDTEEAAALWRDKAAVFIDVLPRPVKPAKLPEGTVWRDKPRHDIPGSVWLPNVGYGVLPAEMDAYFQKGLSDAVGGDLTRPIVVYCLANCWMSWNAAKRALSYGHTQVIWYPAGTDGWQSATSIPLEERQPVALPQ